MITAYAILFISGLIIAYWAAKKLDQANINRRHHRAVCDRLYGIKERFRLSSL